MAASPSSPLGLHNYRYLTGTNFELNITAHAGGGQTSAYPITAQMSVVSTVANVGDSISLPKATLNPPGDSRPGALGQLVFITNAGANACQVFGAYPDVIDGLATGTGISLPAVSNMIAWLVGYTQSTNVGIWEAFINQSGLGTGTVTNVSVTTANGVSGSVANPSTTPAISLTLGAITPSSVAAVGTVTGSNLSGTNTGDQTNISGNAGTATVATAANALNSATTTVVVNAATAPTAGQVLTASSGIAASWTTPAGTGTVTHTGNLTSGLMVIGNGVADIAISKITITEPTTAGTMVFGTDNATITFPGTATLAGLGLYQSWSKAQVGTPVALSVSANAVAVDLSLANNFTLTLQATTSQVLSNPTNALPGQSGSIYITQNATPSTLTFGTNWIEETSGVAPSVSTTPGAQNSLHYEVFDSTHIYYVLNKHGVA